MSTATVSSAIKDANRNTPFSKRFKSQWWRHLLGIIAVVLSLIHISEPTRRS